MEHLEWTLEDKYGDIANEAVSLLRAKGGLTKYSIFDECKNTAIIDAVILEYKDKCSSMFWGFLRWIIGTGIAVAGLYIAYLSFVK